MARAVTAARAVTVGLAQVAMAAWVARADNRGMTKDLVETAEAAEWVALPLLEMAATEASVATALSAQAQGALKDWPQQVLSLTAAPEGCPEMV